MIFIFFLFIAEVIAPNEDIPNILGATDLTNGKAI